MNREQFLGIMNYYRMMRNGSLDSRSKQAMQDRMDELRRWWNRQIMKQYEQKTKISLPMSEMGETVLVDGGLRTYTPPMEE